MTHNPSKSANKHLAIIVSAILHLLFLIWLADAWRLFLNEKPQTSKTFVVHLQTPPEENKESKEKDKLKKREELSKQQEAPPETYAPRHTADETTSPNNQEQKPIPLVGGELNVGSAPESDKSAQKKASQSQGAGFDQRTVATAEKVVSSDSDQGALASDKLQAGMKDKEVREGRGANSSPDSEDQFPEMQLSVSEATANAAPRKLGNMVALEDDELAAIEITSPYAEKHAAALKMVNIYFKRMQEKLYFKWDEPEAIEPWRRVVLKMHLSADGELEDVYVFKTSKNEDFDQSAIAAVKAVGQFEVPDTPEAANFFRVLRVEFVPSDIRQEG